MFCATSKLARRVGMRIAAEMWATHTLTALERFGNRSRADKTSLRRCDRFLWGSKRCCGSLLISASGRLPPSRLPKFVMVRHFFIENKQFTMVICRAVRVRPSLHANDIRFMLNLTRKSGSFINAVSRPLPSGSCPHFRSFVIDGGDPEAEAGFLNGQTLSFEIEDTVINPPSIVGPFSFVVNDTVELGVTTGAGCPRQCRSR